MDELQLEEKTFNRLDKYSVKDLVEMVEYYREALSINQKRKRLYSTNDKEVFEYYKSLIKQWEANCLKAMKLLRKANIKI